MAYRQQERPRVVVCAGCGGTRQVSARVARVGAALCESCRRPRPGPDDRDRVWWLERFNDEELAEIASGLFGRASVDAVNGWRKRLVRHPG